ncbi:hypothetical protein AGMMS49573_07800 [Endomicrobiia bacterium]|nr:hypothetical protein AGMMS49573_07800 [Endomicrobiia bacterium]
MAQKQMPQIPYNGQPPMGGNPAGAMPMGQIRPMIQPNMPPQGAPSGDVPTGAAGMGQGGQPPMGGDWRAAMQRAQSAEAGLPPQGGDPRSLTPPAGGAGQPPNGGQPQFGMANALRARRNSLGY